MIATPWQLGFVTEILLALANEDRAAISRLRGAAPWHVRIFGVWRMIRAASDPRVRAALAPWRRDGAGPRTKTIRSNGRRTLARFGEHGTSAVVVVVEHPSDAYFAAVEIIDRDTFESFGEIV